MTYTIHVTGHGLADDDIRAAFGGLVNDLRSAGDTGIEAHLDTGLGTYTEDDVPEDEPADDEPDEDGPA